MRELEVLGDGHLSLEPAEWKDFSEQELVEQVRAQLKALIEKALECERDRYLDLDYYEHDPEFRLDYRNGYYLRNFATRLGLLEALKIPRTRGGFRTQILPRYQRHQDAVHDLIRQAFLRGISTRQVGEVLEPVLRRRRFAPTTGRSSRRGIFWPGVRSGRSKWCTSSRASRCKTRMWKVFMGSCGMNA